MKITRIATIPLCLAGFITACGAPTSPVSPTTLLSLDDSAAKPPGTTLLPATITLADRPGDAITSDAGGAYENGDRLEVGFYTASKDLVLRGTGRALNLNYTNRVSPTGPMGTTQVSDIFLNIHGILDMAPGTSRTATAAVKRTSTEFFRFNPTYAGATTVGVVRDLGGVWTVTADDPASDRAVLTKNNSTLGLYAMPFQLTAICPTCS